MEAELEKLKTAKDKPEAKSQPKLLEVVNPKVPQFSEAVEVAYNPLVGRHGVATRDIAAGEVSYPDSIQRSASYFYVAASFSSFSPLSWHFT